VTGRRVVVTSSLVRPAGEAQDPPIVARAQGPRWPVARELDEQTELGAVYVRSLMRAQLRLAFAVAAVVVGVVGGLPLVFALGPGVTRLRLAGLPVPWLLLVLCIQPVWIVAAAWHVRQAERLEREFTELVERS
jgi:hypothetical protein